ncbi:D-2-hydroxyacid dehydrogenase [Gemmatimonas groenlandica]|uniref:D-2-hydroxyacid dehydrogenase n=1 Tax=Gemmatimonas groenlandica TaxID=2732249 RepID=A0A6M4IPC2_9BACT|nr:D-2-hydroxyacid dehydrogenase [Gemmatimonas groenlandica]QJR36580.1 D-2-hydroxyacid dehydrogenase [Gemmatimonas groenlandica]
MTFPLPFAPRRIAIGANAHVGIAESIRARRPDLELRGKVFTEITADDLEWAEAYIGFKRPPSVSDMGNVRWIQCTGAGVDSWMASDLDPRILLTRSPESFGPMIAEWAVSRIFAIQLQVLELAAAQRERRWAPRDIARVAGTRALVVGTGDIGRAIASSLQALGVHVTGVSRSGAASSPAFSAVHASSELADLVGNADWIVVAVPDTPASRGLISREVLSRCRGAVLLNAGRGSVVEEAALPDALEKGWLRGAALDVFATEPLPADSPLWSDPRVMVSPHISGLTTIDGAAHGFLECLDSLERGELPKWVVDRARGY